MTLPIRPNIRKRDKDWDDLGPWQYFSPGHIASLGVAPHVNGGKTGAEYNVRQGRRELWKGHRDLSLWGAAVLDDGTVVGCAYPGSPSAGPSLEIVKFDPTGVMTTLCSVPRDNHMSPFGCTPVAAYRPIVRDISVRGCQTVATVAIEASYNKIHAYRFDLRTGAQLSFASLELKHSLDYRVECIAVLELPGLDLWVTHFNHGQRKQRGGGAGNARLGVHDFVGRLLWWEDLMGEYENMSRDDLGESRECDDWLRQSCIRPGGFSFYSVEQGRIDYDVAKVGSPDGAVRVERGASRQ